MARKVCDITNVKMNNGDSFQVVGTPEDLLITFEDMLLRREEFLEVRDGVYIRILDISSLNGLRIGVNFTDVNFTDHSPVFEKDAEIHYAGKRYSQKTVNVFCSCGNPYCKLFMLEGR